MSVQNFEVSKSSRDVEETQGDGLSPNGGKQVALPDISGLLDQIDAVLEKNSEEFVSGFVQKGGQ